MSTDTDTLTRPAGGTTADTADTPHISGDHDLFSHYVPKAELADAIILGTPLRALCGKVWVPSRDPERFPVCPDCQDVYAQMGASGTDVE